MLIIGCLGHASMKSRSQIERRDELFRFRPELLSDRKQVLPNTFAYAVRTCAGDTVEKCRFLANSACNVHGLSTQSRSSTIRADESLPIGFMTIFLPTPNLIPAWHASSNLAVAPGSQLSLWPAEAAKLSRWKWAPISRVLPNAISQLFPVCASKTLYLRIGNATSLSTLW